MAVREAEPVETLQQVKEAGLDREDLLGIYRNMLITRGIEERGHILYKQGKIPGSFYTGRGNEGSAVGVATAMGPNDVGTPLQRDMGVHVTRGIEPWRVFAQYMGREDGPTRGRDGNVHMGDARLGLHTMVSHLPAMLPVAVGMALAFKIRDERRVAVAWCGEGASSRGDAGVHMPSPKRSSTRSSCKAARVSRTRSTSTTKITPSPARSSAASRRPWRRRRRSSLTAATTSSTSTSRAR